MAAKKVKRSTKKLKSLRVKTLGARHAKRVKGGAGIDAGSKDPMKRLS